jgi:hypothetical protein
MNNFLESLKSRNETLFYFGLVCLVLAVLFLILSWVSQIQVNGISAWIKPLKFAFSTFLYAWAMAWYCHYLPDFNIKLFNWAVILLLGFEILYIAIQAGRGQLSHFNVSTPTYSALYSMMAFAASGVTVYTLFVGLLFFTNEFPSLPDYYLWSIRLGILIFVVFSFEGFVMGSRMSHTIGGPDGEEGLLFLNWSTKYGDPRVAHFIGMHALQVLPILTFYIIKNLKGTVILAIVYGLLAVFTLVQALQGKPFIQNKKIYQDETFN